MLSVNAPIFALHPGHITSKGDGQVHYVSAGQLAKLYELRNYEWFIWNDTYDSRFRTWSEYVHLYPNYHGDYGRPHADRTLVALQERDRNVRK